MTAEGAQATAADDALMLALVEKSRAVAARVEGLKRDLAGATTAAGEAQLREAVVRTELTLALHASLAAAAELKARMRALALAAYRRGAPRATLAPRNRKLDRLLCRLGSFGQAVLIARAGVWRGTGRRAFDLRHMAAYARRRTRPGLVAPAFFDHDRYLAAHSDVAAGRIAPLVHYLVAGGYEGRSPHLLFDEPWYRAQAGEAAVAAGVTPLEHYARIGAPQGLSPHPLFDVGHYLAQGPGLRPDEAPLDHYLRQGWRDGLSPHPLFDPAWYAERAAMPAEVNPLVHYLTEGAREGLSTHPLFAGRWYLDHTPEAAEAGGDPLSHFVTRGGFDGRSPSPWFDLPHYVAARGAALAPGVNPLVDYLQGGAWAVTEAKPGFPTAAYLASRPELVREGLTPLEHWARLAPRPGPPAAATPRRSTPG